MHQAHELHAAKLAGPKALDVGAKLFFTSAKTGGIGADEAGTAGIAATPVPEIFEYLAERVVKRWEWEEQTGEAHAGVSDETLATATGGRRRRGALTVKLTETWNGLLAGRDSLLEGCCST